MENRVQTLYQSWLDHVKDNPEERNELEAIRGNDEEIRERFYRDLDFGTAGLRGILGLGTNRMNIYTVRQATQGLADYLLAKGGSPSCAIAYDSRINSDLFALETARVLAANGVTVHLYRELMPTPALSYAVRELHCDAGVVITASHNPAQYNGYKAYGPDGSQLGTEAAAAVMENIRRTDLFTGAKLMDLNKAIDGGLLRSIPEAFVQQYIERVFQEAVEPEVCAKADLKLVYTPLNGAGNRCVRTVLQKAGITDITVVPEQEKPDGHFPTCPYPNPETPEALELGLRLCERVGADMLLATDPDADRTAVAVRDGSEYRILTGNEIGVLLLDYLCKARKKRGTLPERPVAVRSIVSSRLADAVAEEHGVEMVRVFTGFKFIGEVILALEERGEADRYVFGFEESCGYLSGGYVRDKDAVNASLLLAEMASAYKLAGTSLPEVLADIYRRHGVHRNVVDNFTFEGADGMAKMADIMAELRRNPPKDIAGDGVTAFTDHQAGTRTEGGREVPTGMGRSDVLEYALSNRCSVIVRPSGTEPKIKAYYALTADSDAAVDELQRRYQAACKALLGIGS